MFQAPDTDTDPTTEQGGFSAPDTDADAPVTAGDIAKNAGANALRMINPVNIAESLGSTMKQGLYDIPKAAIGSMNDLTRGAAHAIATGELPDADEAEEAVRESPLIKKTEEMTKPIAENPVGYAEKNPLDALALAATPFLAFSPEAAEAETPKAENPIMAAANAPTLPEAEKGLPVMQPGTKTGEPHALFAYNDDFGPGGSKRSIYNVFGDPDHPAVKDIGFGSSVTKADLDKAGIPIVGREPRSTAWEPIEEPKGAPGGTPPPQPPPGGIPEDIKDYVKAKYEAAQKKPGLIPKLGNYLTEESNKLGSKDIGLQSGLIKTMGSGYKGIEKANQLVDYAREKGYLKAGLTDMERRTQIKSAMDQSGDIIGKIRDAADSRGAPDVDAIKTAVKTSLNAKYGSGAEKATAEVGRVMEDLNKAPQTFNGMTELATKLNKAATPVSKLGQHPGPTTDAADIVARMTHDQIRQTLTPEENDLYTQNLRDFGANKKLEQTTSMAARREMGARSNQRGPLGRLWQEALDRGGYRIGGNIAHKLGAAIQSGKIKTLPQFFEDLAHQSNEEIDDTINSFAQGGTVPQDVKEWVGAQR